VPKKVSLVVTLPQVVVDEPVEYVAADKPGCCFGRFGRRCVGRSLAEGSGGSMVVVVGQVGIQDCLEVLGAEDEQVVEALAS
jgi:hypothetical protein